MTKRNPTRKLAAPRHAIKVHGLGDALKAAAVAQELGVPVTLISAPDAAASMGPGWFSAITKCLGDTYPELELEAVLDCGDAVGFALAALRRGVKAIVFSGGTSTTKKLEDIAHAYNARIMKRPKQILDPRREQDIDTTLRHWLQAN
jgi:hypothetical protein